MDRKNLVSLHRDLNTKHLASFMFWEGEVARVMREKAVPLHHCSIPAPLISEL